MGKKTMFTNNVRLVFSFICLVVLLLVPTYFVSGFEKNNNPTADQQAIVVHGQVRFTVLTPQLIRMEWSETGRFEDHASLVFINRRLPVPRFTTDVNDEWLTIKTVKLLVRYKRNSGKFTSTNVEIRSDVRGKKIHWKPGMEDKGNLFGTIRTLDGVKGATSLESGFLSGDGWVLIDDSNRPLFDTSDWQWVMPRSQSDHQDWYFFGYGHNYKKALYDFTQVAGKIPMPPRFAFGLWWSRYWAYTDQEFKQLVHEFENHDVPLDVLVIDMDWHQTFGLRWGKQPKDQAGQSLGWTGYTWDKNYFPDPSGFLRWCESKGLKTPLNLHPASGIQPHEERYAEMAHALGIDPASKKYVPFDIVDKKFATNYLNIILRPLEKQGVDFWWLDWQQWGTTKIAGVTPTWWLNYVHFTDMERQGKARPLLFHRWGGLGNHRYQIGFSGDAISVWESLAFQPYFTATAANVGYGYWSHDIGGHIPGVVSPELYTRWIQFGIFSPIIRTHTTKNPDAERRIWAYPVDYYLAMRDAILLRYALIPYIYTASREAYDKGISICRPMYYDYPEVNEAYEYKDQYMFGDKMIVAPIAAPISPDSMLVAKKIWLPEGEWYEWFTGTRVRGPAVVNRHFALDEIPVYVKAGAIIPMQSQNTLEKPIDHLILTIFPGDSGSVRIYEDEGNSLGYQRGEFARMTVRQFKLKDGSTKVEILPIEGQYPGIPTERTYEVRFLGMLPPEEVLVNGRDIPYSPDATASGWRYDGGELMAVISVPKFRITEKIDMLIRLPDFEDQNVQTLNGVRGKLSRLRSVMTLLNNQWPKEWSPDTLVHAIQTGNRITLNPKTTLAELKTLRHVLPEIVKQIQSLAIDSTVAMRALNHLGGLGKQ